MRNKTFFDYPVFNNIKDIIYYSVNQYPQNVAFRLKERSEENIKYIDITYKEFLDEVNNLGAGLFSLGLKGKRIAILSKNRYEWALSFVSILLGGMVAVPLDKALTEIEIENSLERAKVDAIIYEEKYEEIIDQIKRSGKSSIKTYISMEQLERKRIYKRYNRKWKKRNRKRKQEISRRRNRRKCSSRARIHIWYDI